MHLSTFQRLRAFCVSLYRKAWNYVSGLTRTRVPPVVTHGCGNVNAVAVDPQPRWVPNDHASYLLAHYHSVSWQRHMIKNADLKRPAWFGIAFRNDDDDEMMTHTIKCFPKLAALRLINSFRRVKFITVTTNQRMDEVYVGYSPSRTDPGLYTSAALLTNLTTLEVNEIKLSEEHRWITDELLRFIPLHLKKLRHLTLRPCPEITDVGVGHLCGRRLQADDVIAHLPQLEHLSLLGGEELTDKALQYLAAGQPRLQHLTFTLSLHMTDDGLHALTKMAALKELFLDVDAFQEDVFHLIAEGCLNLDRIYQICLARQEPVKLEPPVYGPSPWELTHAEQLQLAPTTVQSQLERA